MSGCLVDHSIEKNITEKMVDTHSDMDCHNEKKEKNQEHEDCNCGCHFHSSTPVLGLESYFEISLNKFKYSNGFNPYLLKVKDYQHKFIRPPIA